MKAILFFLAFVLPLAFHFSAIQANSPSKSEILNEAGRAFLKNKFETAVQLFSTVRQNITVKKANDLSDEEIYQLIQINRSIARAMAKGGFGDPCKPLLLANENMVALSLRVGTERHHPFEQALSLASRQIQNEAMEHGCVQKIAKNPDPKIAGIYYLRGVMETASGLKLNQDGRYEWFLSVGSLDLISKGNWSRRNDYVQLISDQLQQAPEIILGSKKLPFEPQAEVQEEQAEVQEEQAQLSENSNYAILFKSSEPGDFPPRAFALFTYADGREELVGSVNSGRLDVELHTNDLPINMRFLFVISEEMIEVLTDVQPSSGSMHEFTVRRPSIQELGIGTMLFHVDGDTLKSPDFGGKGAYVKARPKP